MPRRGYKPSGKVSPHLRRKLRELNLQRKKLDVEITEVKRLIGKEVRHSMKLGFPLGVTEPKVERRYSMSEIFVPEKLPPPPEWKPTMIVIPREAAQPEHSVQPVKEKEDGHLD